MDRMMDAQDARDRAGRIEAAMARRGAIADTARPTDNAPAGSSVQPTENTNRAPFKIPAGSNLDGYSQEANAN
jgi:hypothetical protein